MRRVSLRKNASDLPGVDNCVLYMRGNNNLDDETGNHTPAGTTGFGYANGIWSGSSNEAIDITSSANDLFVSDDDLLSFGNGTTDVPFTIFFSINGDNIGVISGGRYDKFILTKFSVGSIIGSDSEYLMATTNDTNNNLRFLIADIVTGGFKQYTGSTSLNNSTNYFISVTYDGLGNDNSLNIYVNGNTETITNSNSGTYNAMTNTIKQLSIGSFVGAAGRYYDGRIENIGIIRNEELTSSEVEEIRQHIIAGNEYL